MPQSATALAYNEPAREDARLAALDRYDVMDSPPEEAFDRITRMVQQIFGVKMSIISLIDGHRQWFKSKQGIGDCSTERAPAVCNITIQHGSPFIIPDTLKDERFVNHPHITGEPHIRFYAGAQLRSRDGHAIGTLCAMDDQPREFSELQVALLKDMAALVMNELELRKVAMNDSLTGALSRHAFCEEAERAISLALRHKHDLSCAIFDLDHFKSINDTHGHGVGDLVLTACVEMCRQEMREADIVGRIGGEEFAVLLPHTGATAAMQVMEKVRQAMERIYVPGANGTPVKISASFGVTSLDRSVNTIDDMLRRADIALYEAKNAGRNACHLWKSPEPVVSGVMRRVFKAGKISFNAGGSSIDCTVRGVSDAGAALAVFSSANIPERFKLNIPADSFHRACRIVSKSDKEIEVAFV